MLRQRVLYSVLNPTEPNARVHHSPSFSEHNMQYCSLPSAITSFITKHVSLQIYICGGFNGSECLSTAECYSPETNQWTMIATMDNRRSGIGVIAYANYIFAVSTLNAADTHQTQTYQKLFC